MISPRQSNHSQKGAASLLAVFFVSLFAVLSISFAAMTNMNVRLAVNHRDVTAAHAAAESGLQYASALIASYVPPSEAYSAQNTVSDQQAQDTFAWFADHVTNTLAGSPVLGGAGIAIDLTACTMRVPATGFISLDANPSGAGFALQFELFLADADDTHRILVTSTGANGEASRSVILSFTVRKDGEVLEYAVASRGRMWIVGDSTIHGSIYSTWDRPEISPFMLAPESTVEGTINTILERDAIEAEGYQLETLDADGNPMYDDDGNRIVGDDDMIQGEHQGVNYEVSGDHMSGMDISDYDTSAYRDMVSSIPSSSDRQREYFPHAAGSYTTPRDYYSRSLDRHVYENQNFTNAGLPANRNALFRNCTFDGILYIDAAQSTSYYYNNVRFEDCTFNGTIVTNTPQSLKWQNNCLYFTGSATFQNDTMAQATILAPHFNVNLGNTNPIGTEQNTLRGAIVGGIVDVRGNADIYGTIISMCDTTQWSSGYVTNIGATLDDGGSETTEPGDIGIINITPDPDNMLPSGIITPIIIDRDANSYVEL